MRAPHIDTPVSLSPWCSMKSSLAATVLRLWRSHKRHIYYAILALSALSIVYIAIYSAYNARFIVDEVYQGKGPREYTIDEKITLRLHEYFHSLSRTAELPHRKILHY